MVRGQHHDAGIAERADIAREVEHDLGALRFGGGDAGLIGDGDIGLTRQHGGDFGTRVDRHDRRIHADLEAGLLQQPLGDAVIGVRLGRSDDLQALEFLRVGDRLERFGHAEIMCALHDRADHDARAAVLARNLRHRGVADGKIRRAAEHRRESLSVAAGRADLHVEAVLLEDAGVHADIEIDVAEIVDGLAETHFLERRGSGQGPSRRTRSPDHPRQPRRLIRKSRRLNREA